MKTKLLSCLLAAATALCLTAENASAGLIVTMIDDFVSGPQSLNLSGTTGTLTDAASGNPADILGGERNLTFNVGVNRFGLSATASVNPAVNDSLNVDLGPFVNGDTTVTYDGTGSSGLGGIDLTSGGGIALAIDFIATNPITVTAEVVDTASNVATLTFLQATPIITPERLVLPFAAFANAAQTDFSQVDRVSVNFAPQNSGNDFGVGLIGTTNSLSSTPEPGTPLLVLAAITLAITHRSRRVHHIG
ncbi:MAG: hypothetical protein AAF591_11405 [Verrucomicrobiota bacterium]